MARSKRKATELADPPASTPDKRQRKSGEATASSNRPRRTSVQAASAPRSAPRSTRSSVSDLSSTTKKPAGNPRKAAKLRTASVNASASVNGTPTKRTVSTTKASRDRKKSVNSNPEKAETTTRTQISVDVPKMKEPVHDTKAEHDRELEENIDSNGPSYWLMKAEPESRITDKGKDVKFSIDDLKAATAPEAWDGVRNAVARNNMRLMMKGDLAFFYHSNCKVPGIVGIMEVVQEHSVDDTAFDKDHPYYDEKSDPEKPKWQVVHVEFRQKLPKIIKLKELQKYAKDGGVLEHLQTLKQTRLSVSKVTQKEWNFIMDLVDPEEVAAASAQHQPNMID